MKAAAVSATKFADRYTKADVELLAYVDKCHGNLSGPATKRILEREYSEYGQSAYQRLAGISVAQIYRFRNSEAYRKTQHQLPADAPHADPDRRAAQTAAAGPARLSAHRHRASGRQRWRQGHLSHQCRRRSDAMGDCGGHPADLRILADSAAGSDYSDSSRS